MRHSGQSSSVRHEPRPPIEDDQENFPAMSETRRPAEKMESWWKGVFEVIRHRHTKSMSANHGPEASCARMQRHVDPSQPRVSRRTSVRSLSTRRADVSRKRDIKGSLSSPTT